MKLTLQTRNGDVITVTRLGIFARVRISVEDGCDGTTTELWPSEILHLKRMLEDVWQSILEGTNASKAEGVSAEKPPSG